MNTREAYEAMLRAVEAVERQSRRYTWGVSQHPLNAIDTTGRDVTAKRRQRPRQQLESGPR